MNIAAMKEKHTEYIIELRRYFHQHPELSLEEFETTAFIAKELDKLNISYEKSHPTGLIGKITGLKPGKTVALRSDIDALKITQKNNVTYQSKNVGKMHACGHDAHMAMLLGAAKILMDNIEEVEGTIYLIFQPAEEIGQGAKIMINTGDWYEEIDSIFGLHIWSGLETGKISLESGERMAAADRFVVNIKGKSGHGSMPHQTVDAVVVASATVMNLQTIVSREYAPLDPLVISVGSIHSGDAFNVISGEAILDGTVRYFKKSIGDSIIDSISKVIKSTASLYGASSKFEYFKYIPPLYNDEGASRIAHHAAIEVLGEDNIVTMEKTTGGEDFAFYLEHKPGCFAFLGSKNIEKKTDAAHHNDHFDIDEDVLINGSLLDVQYALNYLNHQ